MVTKKSSPHAGITQSSYPRVPGTRRHFEPKLTRTTAVHVYQPAVPLRCVYVLCSVDTGLMHREDEHVLGIQATVVDEFIGPKTPIENLQVDRPAPSNYSPEAIESAGFKPDQDIVSKNGTVRHHVVIWGFQDACPIALDDSETEGGNWRRIVGPMSAQPSWWCEKIQEAEKEIREQMAQRGL